MNAEETTTPYTLRAKFDKGDGWGYLTNWEEPVVWTRIDGHRYKDLHELKPSYSIRENKSKVKKAQKMLDEMWSHIKEKGKKILLAGPFGSNEYIETYILGKYMYRQVNFGTIEYGATSRLKNEWVWRSKEN